MVKYIVMSYQCSIRLPKKKDETLKVTDKWGLDTDKDVFTSHSFQVLQVKVEKESRVVHEFSVNTQGCLKLVLH